MVKFKPLGIFLYILVIFSLIPSKLYASDASIDVCIDDWPPYIEKDQDGHGPLPRLVKDAFSLQGVEVVFKWAPWSRCMENVRLGVWDASPGWVMSEKRKEKVLFSEPMTKTYHLLAYTQGSAFDWSSWEDLKGMVIGTTRGYHYGEEFAQSKKDGIFKVQEANTDISNFKKLIAGHIDLFVVNGVTGPSIAEKALNQKAANIRFHPLPVGKTKQSHLILTKSKEGESLRNTFNEGLSAISRQP